MEDTAISADPQVKEAPRSERVVDVFYEALLHWIIFDEGGGGWPPQDVRKVSGWRVVRMLADVFDKPTRDVAYDLIERYQARAN